MRHLRILWGIEKDPQNPSKIVAAMRYYWVSLMAHAFDDQHMARVNRHLIMLHGYDLRADYFFAGSLKGRYGYQSSPFTREERPPIQKGKHKVPMDKDAG